MKVFFNENQIFWNNMINENKTNRWLLYPSNPYMRQRVVSIVNETFSWTNIPDELPSLVTIVYGNNDYAESGFDYHIMYNSFHYDMPSNLYGFEGTKLRLRTIIDHRYYSIDPNPTDLEIIKCALKKLYNISIDTSSMYLIRRKSIEKGYHHCTKEDESNIHKFCAHNYDCTKCPYGESLSDWTYGYQSWMSTH